jgi:hypothetical protein
MTKATLLLGLGLASALAAAAPAAAVTIDGAVDAAYGAPLCVQTVQSSFGDQTYPYSDIVTHARASELDQAFGFIEGGVLYLFVAGNVRGFFAGEWYPQDQLHVFIDVHEGGQNALRADNPAVGFRTNALTALAGLTFDADFAPDYWLNCTVWSNDPPLYAYCAELPAGGGGAGAFLGRAAAGGPGTLTEGANPNGIEVTVNNGNLAGVTYGCDASSGADVTTGVEWAIPLTALGDPAGCVEVCALVNISDSYDANAWVANQVLGPLPAGTCTLTVPSQIDFDAFAGSQHFTVCPTPTAVREDPATWGRLKARYR